MAQLVHFRTNQGNCCRIGSIQDVECACKTEQTVVMSGMFFLVDGSSTAAVGLMQTQLGEQKIVNGGSLGELSANEPKQQRLHDQRVDRCCANQPSPEAQSRTRSISRGSHAHESYVEGVLNALTRFADASDWCGSTPTAPNGKSV